MSAETMSEETLAMVAGALLSLAFSYIPGLQSRYEALSAEIRPCPARLQVAPGYKRMGEFAPGLNGLR